MLSWKESLLASFSGAVFVRLVCLLEGLVGGSGAVIERALSETRITLPLTGIDGAWLVCLAVAKPLSCREP